MPSPRVTPPRRAAGASNSAQPAWRWPQRTLTISPQDFYAVELVRGPGFPETAPWVSGQRAWIPMCADLISPARPTPPADQVILFADGTGADGTGADAPLPLVWRDGDTVATSVDIARWRDVMTAERYRDQHKLPVTARLPFHYHNIPGPLRKLLARLMLKGGAIGVADAPGFPGHNLNGGPEIFLAAVRGRGHRDERGERGEAPVPVLVLTHDIDTGRGFRMVDRIAALEEEFGFRSSWHVVADHYPIDDGVLRDLLRRGHEIGLHGLWHTNREAFLAPAELRAHLRRVKPVIDAFGMRGYRGPSWYRTAALYPVLAEFFDYDLSCLDIDLCCPGGPGGVGLARPYRMPVGLIEIPCTLPFESPLLQGRAPAGLADYWAPKIDFIARVGGALVVNTHPEPDDLGRPEVLAEYRTLLDRLARADWTCRLPGQVADGREFEQ